MVHVLILLILRDGETPMLLRIQNKLLELLVGVNDCVVVEIGSSHGLLSFPIGEPDAEALDRLLQLGLAYDAVVIPVHVFEPIGEFRYAHLGIGLEAGEGPIRLLHGVFRAPASINLHNCRLQRIANRVNTTQGKDEREVPPLGYL